jgi:hypothetical protein
MTEWLWGDESTNLLSGLEVAGIETESPFSVPTINCLETQYFIDDYREKVFDENIYST